MYSSSRALYRTRQFAQALRPRFRSRERAQAAAVLGGQLLPLFDSMSLRDRRHCFDVYRTLLTRGCDDLHVLTAALLHDAGKGHLAGARVRLWHRVAYVLLAAGARGLLPKLTSGRGGLATLHNHSERGGALAREFGATPEVVDLIDRHEDHAPTDPRLQQLRAADDAS